VHIYTYKRKSVSIIFENKKNNVAEYFFHQETAWSVESTVLSARLATLNIQSSEHRRILSDLTLCYKLQHHYCDSSVADFFKVCSTSMVRNYTKNTAQMMLPKIIFLTELLIFKTVFPHALFLPPV